MVVHGEMLGPEWAGRQDENRPQAQVLTSSNFETKLRPAGASYGTVFDSKQ